MTELPRPLRAVLLALLNREPGAEMSTRALCAATEMSPSTFYQFCSNASPDLLVSRRVDKQRGRHWSLGQEGEAMRAQVVELTESLPARRRQLGCFEPEAASILLSTPLVGRLRDLMNVGDLVNAGNVVRAVADLLETAQHVHAVGALNQRFSGAEKDLVTARALRSVSEAAQAARAELLNCLEILAL